ncbi:unnamed protein product [Sphagnum troendelagicum]|uniref:GTD-binding domain-containing protein n=1 Tax=Sphagnum troendelagicum TaxID=128251 RepID=A0ABP0TB91_9BRYO
MSRARTSMKWDAYHVKTTILRCIFAFDIEICFLDSPTVCRCYVFLWGLKAILKFKRRTIQQEEASFSYYYYVKIAMKDKDPRRSSSSHLEMARKGQASNRREIVCSASSIIIAAVELSFAWLVLLCLMISFFTSRFIPISGFHDSCSWLVYHLKGGGSQTEEDGLLPFRTCAEDRLKVNSLEESGKTGAHQDPRELANAAEGEAADGDGDEWRAKQTFDKSREAVNLEESLQAERGEALAAIYLELEKERNASATAANEAMGMIARLQEEKAAVVMEARQFRRLVDEKSMHDQEAIEYLQKVLANSEEEKSELEEEIFFYRMKLLREQMEEKSIGARRNGNSFLLLSGTLPEERRGREKSKEKAAAASARAANDRGADEDQSMSKVRTNEAKYQIRSPLLGLRPTKTARATTRSLSAMGTTKKQLVNTLVVKPENGNEAEFMSLRTRLSSACPSDAATESLGKGQEASDRALEEERRSSVLEYVWKLEEEFHEKARRKQPAQIGRSKNAQVLRSKTQSPVERAVTSEMATKAETSMSVMTEDNPLWQRCHERKPSERNLGVSSFVQGYGSVNPDQHSEADQDENRDRPEEAGMSMVSGDETAGQCSDEVLFEHDVYEVQESSDELQRLAGELCRLRSHQPDSHGLSKANLLYSDDDLRNNNRNGMEYNGELKLLQEIAKQLRELHGMEWKGLQGQDSLSNAIS